MSVARRERHIECIVCDKVIPFDTYYNPAPGAPELLRGPGTVWYGVAWDGAENPLLLVCCSEHCVRQLLVPS